MDANAAIEVLVKEHVKRGAGTLQRPIVRRALGCMDSHSPRALLVSTPLSYSMLPVRNGHSARAAGRLVSVTARGACRQDVRF